MRHLSYCASKGAVQSHAVENAAVAERMREDWNRRAREDAHYYVAFGRHDQDEEEFYATAYETVYGLEYELKRFPRHANRRAWRALEIGCGPGRLMRPLSRHFGEIHGVDVSDEMIGLARQRLRDIPHAHPHVSYGADLRQFADESFDLVYSYAVFQHIPDRAVVMSYLKEARRVLKTGGLFWFQVNGLPEADAPPDTWNGVKFRPEEVVAFANENDFQMYTLEGVNTQYMWTSLCKRPDGWFSSLPRTAPEPDTRIRHIANPHGTEPGVPCGGRFAVASLWTERLPEECGLNHLTCQIAGQPARPNYIAPRLPGGEQQINVVLPEQVPTGLVPVRLFWLGRPLGQEAIMRVVPASPQVPRLISVTDASDLMLGTRIASGAVKVVFEEVSRVEDVAVQLDGRTVEPSIVHWADRRTPRVELVYDVKPDGLHRLDVQARRQRWPPVWLEVAAILES